MGLTPARAVLTSQWIKDIAEAGGSSYTFHLEAACEYLSLFMPKESLLWAAPDHYLTLDFNIFF